MSYNMSQNQNSLSENQLAVMNIHYIYYELEYFFQKAEELQIKNVDLWSGYPHFLIEAGSMLSQSRRIKAMSQKYGTKIICCTPEQVSYPVNIAEPDALIRNRSVQYLLNALDAASELEAALLQVVPGRGFYNVSTDIPWQCMCDSLYKLAERGKELGIQIVLEPLQIIESNLVGDVTTAAKALQDVGHSNLKLVVDTCHMAVKGENLETYFETLGAFIAHIHLNESDQVPWGEGHSPLRHYLSVLKQYGYNHYLTLEICSMIHQVCADRALRDNITFVRKAMREMSHHE